jgi:hypothetical protein
MKPRPMRRAIWLTVMFAALGCMPRAARIPPKAASDMQCAESQLTVLEVENQGDSGPHLVMGCGKKAVYELNNLGEWVVNAPIVKDPTHIKITPAPP